MRREDSPLQNLSRRERQIVDIIYRRGRATAAQVVTDMSDAPSYSAVRAHLATLERKGHVIHEGEGNRYVYLPVHPRPDAGRAALKRAVQTFYQGSVEDAVAALLDTAEGPLSPEKVERLAKLIGQTKKAGG